MKRPQPRLALTALALTLIALALTWPLGVLAQDPEDADERAADAQPWHKMNQQAFADYVETVRATMRLPAVSTVVVHRTEGVVFAQGFGESASGEAVSPQTPFLLGRLGRSFTATLVMRLVEAGKLSLDRPVKELLPNLTLSDAAGGAITVRHLLHHTSGLSRRQGLGFWTGGLDDLQTFSVSDEPGQRFSDSELDEILLVRIIEAVGEKPYAAQLQAQVLDPLGLKHTFGSLEQARAGGLIDGQTLVYGYSIPGEEPTVPADAAPAQLLAASGADLGRWMQAHLQAGTVAQPAPAPAPRNPAERRRRQRERRAKARQEALQKAQGEQGEPAQIGPPPAILKPESFALMHKGTSAHPCAAMGWTRDEEGRVSLSQGGQTATSSAAMILLPGQDMGVAVVVNVNSFQGAAAAAIRDGFVKLLLTRTAQVYAFAEFFLRLFAGAMALLMLVDLFWQCLRWTRLRPVGWPAMTGKRKARAAFAVGLPLLILIAAPFVTGLTYPAMFVLHPDLAIAMVVGCPIGLIKGLFKLALDARHQDVINVTP